MNRWSSQRKLLMVTSTCLNKTSVTTVNNTISMLLVLVKIVIHVSIIDFMCKLIVEKRESPNLNLRTTKIPCVKLFTSLLWKSNDVPLYNKGIFLFNSDNIKAHLLNIFWVSCSLENCCGAVLSVVCNTSVIC